MPKEVEKTINIFLNITKPALAFEKLDCSDLESPIHLLFPCCRRMVFSFRYLCDFGYFLLFVFATYFETKPTLSEIASTVRLIGSKQDACKSRVFPPICAKMVKCQSLNSTGLSVTRARGRRGGGGRGWSRSRRRPSRVPAVRNCAMTAKV